MYLKQNPSKNIVHCSSKINQYIYQSSLADSETTRSTEELPD